MPRCMVEVYDPGSVPIVACNALNYPILVVIDAPRGLGSHGESEEFGHERFLSYGKKNEYFGHHSSVVKYVKNISGTSRDWRL